MKKVGIIGASGFIGSYVTKQFLESGFLVKASVTDLSRTQKYEHLKQFKNAQNLQIATLDVTDKNQLADFVKDCDIVIHGGTPFQLNFTDAKKELLDPTIIGTKNFLEVVNDAPKVSKVVVISSVASWNTNFPMPAGDKSFTDTYDETQERFMSEESHPYAQAKFLANKAVYEFLDYQSDISFELTSVSPVGVMGKALSTREDSTSMGLQYLIKNKIAPDAFVQAMFDHDILFAIVDVEDVAHAIFKAATTSGLHAKDYLLSSESYKVSDINLMLNLQEPKETGQIIYKNNKAIKDLVIDFKAVKQTLNNYSSN